MKRSSGLFRVLVCFLLVCAGGPVRAADRPPIWISKPVPTALIGQPYESFLLAMDPDGEASSYALLTAPDWLEIAEVSEPRIYSIAGSLDRGSGLDALTVQLNSPVAGALDSLGNLYVADAGNHRVWKRGTNGVMVVVAGTGEPGYSGDGGLATRARLLFPAGLAVDTADNVYVADTGNHRVRRISPAGLILTIAGDGLAGFGGDGGSALRARFNRPEALAWWPAGRLYVADAQNHRIRMIDEMGIITTVAGTGEPGFSGDGGPAVLARLRTPRGLTVLPDGSLVIADSANARLRQVGLDGVVRTIAGTGEPGISGDGGPATAAKLFLPVSLAASPEGIWMVEAFDARVRHIAAGSGVINSVPGTGQTGTGSSVQASGVAIQDTGRLIVFEGPTRRVSVINSAGVVTQRLAGLGSEPDSGEGQPATSVPLAGPIAATIGPEGSIYVAEAGRHRVLRINADQTLTVVAGTGVAGFGGDGAPGPTTALSDPGGLTFDPEGNLYIAESGNHRIRKLSPGGILTTFAGTGQAGGSGDGGRALEARLASPRGLAFDAAGNLYVADQGNNRIRRIQTDGTIQTVAGTGVSAFRGDHGPATNAWLWGPNDLAFDAAGNLYVADTLNHRVRKIDRDGVISTLAGTGSPGFSGDGGPASQAQLNFPRGLTASPDGFVYVADFYNHRIRRIRPDGIIETVVGAAVADPDFGGFSGDGGPPLLATMGGPTDVELIANGDLVIVETHQGFVRRVFHQGWVLRGVPLAATPPTQPVALRARAGALASEQNFELHLESLPVVTRQPRARVVAPGAAADFRVEASGTPPLSYQWLRNGAVLSDGGRFSGVTTPQFRINDVRPADQATYAVLVLNAAGAVASDTASLEVSANLPPEIFLEPDPQLGSGHLKFRVAGPAGAACEIQSSPDLQAWSRLREIILDPNGVVVIDAVAGERRFYRGVIR